MNNSQMVLAECQRLAESIIVYSEDLSDSNIERYALEIGVKAEEFYGIAIRCSYLLDEVNDPEVILVRCISFIGRMYVHPWIGEDNSWFYYSLNTLLTLCGKPNTYIEEDHLAFLEDLKSGIDELAALSFET